MLTGLFIRKTDPLPSRIVNQRIKLPLRLFIEEFFIQTFNSGLYSVFVNEISHFEYVIKTAPIMNASLSTPESHSPAVIALGNAAYATLVCTAIHILCGWGIDWVNGLVGNPPAHKAPTWTGTAIVAAQTGWPVLAVAVVTGLFGRNLSGRTLQLIAIHFLGLIDPIAAIVVGGILMLLQRSHENRNQPFINNY